MKTIKHSIALTEENIEYIRNHELSQTKLVNKLITDDMNGQVSELAGLVLSVEKALTELGYCDSNKIRFMEIAVDEKLSTVLPKV